jgi:nicotinamide phosphoribosyltransferase
MKFNFNSLFLSDGYKIGHKAMLAEGTDYLYGTWIPRSVKHAPKGITKIVSFGQQMVVKWLHDEFEENFFKLREEDAMSFVSDMSEYLGMSFDGEHMRELHRLGYLPIHVKALPEGIETPVNVPHMTFVNTKPGFAWLTLYLETIISALAWKPSTSATLALAYRRNLVKWVNETDNERDFLVDFLAHDFSARGLSPWDMISSGLGHATSFRGSDTLPVIPAARYFYGETAVAINSVNASEHSVSTTKIFTVGEQQMISDWMKVFPTGILSIVSDTFDLWKLITEYLPMLKEEIMGRDGKIVVRPDSGDPVDIICGKSKNLLRVNAGPDPLTTKHLCEQKRSY